MEVGDLKAMGNANMAQIVACCLYAYINSSIKSTHRFVADHWSRYSAVESVPKTFGNTGRNSRVLCMLYFRIELAMSAICFVRVQYFA